jgi:hypothetical protein
VAVIETYDEPLVKGSVALDTSNKMGCSRRMAGSPMLSPKCEDGDQKELDSIWGSASTPHY